jgi:hypothetical protein
MYAITSPRLITASGNLTYLIIRPGPANELSVKQAVALIP